MKVGTESSVRTVTVTVTVAGNSSSNRDIVMMIVVGDPRTAISARTFLVFFCPCLYCFVLFSLFCVLTVVPV